MTPGLTMRPTGLGHGIYASVMASMPRSCHIYNDAVDFSGFSGGWAIGRIYERKGFGDAVGFFWSLHGVVLTAWDPHRQSRAHPCNGEGAAQAEPGPVVGVVRASPDGMIMIIGMPRVAAPAFLIAFLSVAAGCSQIAQKEDDRKEVARQLTDAYYSCVRTSFASQRPTMVDRNMAIDQAFSVCQTEESKLVAFENPQDLNVSTAGIARHRNTLKDELLRR